MAEDCSSTQLIYGDGEFNKAGLENFMESVNLSSCELSYAIVAILGPQSSGKSTLLNHLFSTNFAVMDSAQGRNQTTKGIWLAKAVSIAEPLTIILDIEGVDGQERGEDVAFEKRSSLYALALADIVLINMWHNDIGRENAASKPLLRCLFEAMTKLFPPRKTTLLFVIRDTDKDIPAQRLHSDIAGMIVKIWDEVPKPDERKNANLKDFFEVKVMALSHYKFQNAVFQDEVAKLREQFKTSITPGGLAGDSHGRLPGSAFPSSAQRIWELIQDYRELDLPTLKKMIATVRCDAIAEEKLAQFAEDEDWIALQVSAISDPVSDFGKQLSSILGTYLSKYEIEAKYFDDVIRDSTRLKLESNMLAVVQPTHAALLGRLLSEAKATFENQLELQSRGERFTSSLRTCKESCLLGFDKQCQDVTVKQAPQWDATHVKEELTRHIDDHGLSLLAKYSSEIVANYEKKIADTVERYPIDQLLVEDSSNWNSIRELTKRDTEITASEFVASISVLELDNSEVEHMLRGLEIFTRSLIENKARGAATDVAKHMMDGFVRAFLHDRDFMPRLWSGELNIELLAEDARLAALKILSAMSVIRLEETSDNIENILISSLMNNSTDDDVPVTPLLKPYWEEVSPADTIITPAECKVLWGKFLEESAHIVNQTAMIQAANKVKDKAEADAKAARIELAACVAAQIAAAKAEVEAIGKTAMAEAAIERERADAAVAAAKFQAAEATAKAEEAEANARDEAAKAAERYKNTAPTFSTIVFSLVDAAAVILVKKLLSS